MFLIKIKMLNGHAVVPKFAHSTDSGADLYTCAPLRLKPGEKGIAKTGIAIALPEGFGATIRNKSGNTVKGVLVDIIAPSFIDDSYDTPQNKKWNWIRKGCPLRLEIGKRDIAIGRLAWRTI